MKSLWNNNITIYVVIIGISIGVWILLLFNPGHIMTMEHCHVSTSSASYSSLKMLLQMNPFSTQLLGWGLMVIAMMLPKLIYPVQLISKQSLRRYRFTNAFLFVLAYIAVWMFVGVFMVGIIIAFNLFMPMSYIPALGVLIVAVIWQFSPYKQRFLNLGHDHYLLSAFGWDASRDALHYGFQHGIWCVGSGWALMLFPMVLPTGHNLAMIIVTFIMLNEHLENPRYPEWKINPRLKVVRYVIAQAKIKLMILETSKSK